LFYAFTYGNMEYVKNHQQRFFLGPLETYAAIFVAPVGMYEANWCSDGVMHPFAEIFKQLSLQLKHNKVYILEIYFINVWYETKWLDVAANWQ